MALRQIFTARTRAAQVSAARLRRLTRESGFFWTIWPKPCTAPRRRPGGAPVGILRRAVVVDAGTGLYQLVNPVVVKKEGSACGMEACLSVPDKQGYVLRPEKRSSWRRSENPANVANRGEGYLAVAMCHEIDHWRHPLYGQGNPYPRKNEGRSPAARRRGAAQMGRQRRRRWRRKRPFGSEASARPHETCAPSGP